MRFSAGLTAAALIAGTTQAAPTYGLLSGLLGGITSSITTAVHTELSSLLESIGVSLQSNAKIHGEALAYHGTQCPFTFSSQSGVSVSAGLSGSLSHSASWAKGCDGKKFINWKTFKSNGVTLSGWLTQDRSLDVAWWNKYAPDAEDEWSLCETLGVNAGAVLEVRYQSFITTATIDALAKAGVNLLRIPTHYAAWVSVPGSALYHGNQQVYLKAICKYAIEKYGMHIVISLDSLPGGVNGLGAGGQIGATGWFNSAENLSYSFKAVDAILAFISASGHVNGFTISPINEPCDNTADFATTAGLSLSATNFVNTYFKGVIAKVAKVDARIPCMLQDAFLGHDYWAAFYDSSANICIDSHVSFSASASASASVSASATSSISAGLIAPSVCKQASTLAGNGKFPVFVGSWGIEAHAGNTLAGRATVFNTQKYAYSQHLAGGSFCSAVSYSSSVSVSGEGCASDYSSFTGLISAGVASSKTESCYC